MGRRQLISQGVLPSGKFVGLACNFSYKMSFSGILPDSLLQFSLSGRIYRSFKAVRGTGNAFAVTWWE